MGYTDGNGNAIPDDASTQYPASADPDLQYGTITPEGAILAGSTFAVSVPANMNIWDTATHQLVYDGEVFSSAQPLHFVAQATDPTDPRISVLIGDDVLGQALQRKGSTNVIVFVVQTIIKPDVKVGAVIDLPPPASNDPTKTLFSQLKAIATSGLGKTAKVIGQAFEPDGTLKGESGILVVQQISANDITYTIRPFTVEFATGDFLHKITFNATGPNNRKISAEIDKTLAVKAHEDLHVSGANELLSLGEAALMKKLNLDSAEDLSGLVKHPGYIKGATDNARIANGQIDEVIKAAVGHGITTGMAMNLLGVANPATNFGPIIFTDVTGPAALKSTLSYGYWHIDLNVTTTGTPPNQVEIFNYTYSPTKPVALVPYKLQLP